MSENNQNGMVFVFGSNMAGRHGAGAALHARRYHGATYGAGEGALPDWRFRGSPPTSYAIPTKDNTMRTLPLDTIKHKVTLFINYAEEHNYLVFYVTAIGCGLARYTNHQIAPLFAGAPANCWLPPQWRPYLGDGYNYWTTECKH